MAKAKKIDLELVFPAHQAVLFRVLVHKLNYQDRDDPTKYTGPSGVEILYEEPGATSLGNPTVAFSLWFDKPATAYWFARHLEEAKDAWQAMAQPPAVSYPRFLYVLKSRTWLRYNTPEYFCLVADGHLQVRRERPQELFKPEEVEAITEASFLEAYQRTRAHLQDLANQHYSTYQRRGSEGDEWFYCNPLYATAPTVSQHLRLNVSASEYGRSWQLLYDFDMRRNDPRRVASTEQEFEQQLQLMLSEIEAAATGEQEGGQHG